MELLENLWVKLFIKIFKLNVIFCVFVNDGMVLEIGYWVWFLVKGKYWFKNFSWYLICLNLLFFFKYFKDNIVIELIVVFLIFLDNFCFLCVVVDYIIYRGKIVS